MRWSPLPNSWMEAAERNQSRCKSFPAVQMSGIPQTPTQVPAPPAFPDTSRMAAQAGRQQEGSTKIMRENSQPLQMQMGQTVGLKCAEDMANPDRKGRGWWGRGESSSLRVRLCEGSGSQVQVEGATPDITPPGHRVQEPGASQHWPVKIEHKSHRVTSIF